jgi:hypothetical protein
VNKFDKLYYFPAYELVMDVLRDYRFYDIDLAHPIMRPLNMCLNSFQQLVWMHQQFQLAEEIKRLFIAKNHKPFNPSSQQHKKFLQTFLDKAKSIAAAISSA